MSFQGAVQAATTVNKGTVRKADSRRWQSLWRGHLKMIGHKERESPNRTIEVAIPARQNKRTGLRPT
jgi:hypothetical protein